jgi:hypothetical protein
MEKNAVSPGAAEGVFISTGAAPEVNRGDANNEESRLPCTSCTADR